MLRAGVSGWQGGLAFPTALTTGPAAAGYTNLTPYTAENIPASAPYPDFVTVQGDGSLLVEGALLSGTQMEIDASNVTFLGCQFVMDSGFFCANPNGTGYSFLWCDMGPDGVEKTSINYGIEGGTDMTVLGCHLHGWNTQGIITPGDGVLIQGNLIDGWQYVEGNHSDPLYLGGTTSGGSDSGCSVIGNSLWAPLAGGNNSAVIYMNDHGQSFTDFTIQGNLLAGGGYTLYLGEDNGGSNTDLIVAGNYFSTAYKSTCGKFGYATGAPTWGENGCTWEGNYWYDGPSAGQPVAAP